MDRRLLERTTEFARRTKAFDWRKLPKTLRVAVDSSPLEGAGRVEDTINLLAHAARKVVECAAALLGWDAKRVATEAGIPVLLDSSVKRALDREWGTSEATADAVNKLVRQLDALESWLARRLSEELKSPPLKDHVETLQQIRNQDLEPDPSGGGTRIREGVAPDRRISVSDKDMRHGRKSKSRRINGYKRHIATDLDTRLVLACAVTPANLPEQEALAPLHGDLCRYERDLDEAHMDRGYISSPLVAQFVAAGTEVVCKPWAPQNGNLFTKADFKIDVRRMTITCPAGQQQPIREGVTVEFNAMACRSCRLRSRCTSAETHGRLVRIAKDERLQHRLRKLIATRRGRERLRERVAIEHSLAHLSRRQGRRARYRGTRKNLFDTRRAAAVQNLESLQYRIAGKAA